MIKIICEPSYARWQERRKQLFNKGWQPVSKDELVKGEDRILGVVVRVEFDLPALFGRVADEVDIAPVLSELEGAIERLKNLKSIIEQRGKYEQARREKDSQEARGQKARPFGGAVFC